MPTSFTTCCSTSSPATSHLDDLTPRHGDSRRAIRTARTTRPLGLKCCDSKTIAALVARPLSVALHNVAPQHQRGFLPTRRTYENLLDFDSHARELCLRSMDPDDVDVDNPVAITHDTRAAVPSMIRAAPRHAARRAGLPTEVQTLIRATQYHCSVYVPGGTSCCADVTAQRGVTQGCPLSAALFVLSTEPVLNCFEATVHGHHMTLAYADDIAILVRSSKFIGYLARVGTREEHDHRPRTHGRRRSRSPADAG